MLGDLIAGLDRPEIVHSVLATLALPLREELQRRAAAAGMTPEDFAAGAVHEFVESADDELWFQLLTVMRKADDPGLVAVQTILRWVGEADR